MNQDIIWKFFQIRQTNLQNPIPSIFVDTQNHPTPFWSHIVGHIWEKIMSFTISKDDFGTLLLYFTRSYRILHNYERGSQYKFVNSFDFLIQDFVKKRFL